MRKAAEKRRRELAAKGRPEEGETSKPVAPAPASEPEREREAKEAKRAASVDVDAVFATLGGGKVTREEEDEEGR